MVKERRKKYNNFTMKESKCYANTKLGKTTVIVYSSAFSWLLVTMICVVRKRNFSHWLLLICAEVVVLTFFFQSWTVTVLASR